MKSMALAVAGGLSFVAAALHMAIIVGGPAWYRFFGAGEGMARLAEQGSLRPTLITLGIASVLSVWGAYAWSGAGLIPRLPLLRLALVAITGVYLIRGLLGLLAPLASTHPVFAQNSVQFWLWSSTICLVFAVTHLLGLSAVWRDL